VIPAHYPGRGGATIRAVADQFDVDRSPDVEALLTHHGSGPVDSEPRDATRRDGVARSTIAV